MNILVTGATGFIASQIVTDLISQGHNLTCCVRDVAAATKQFPSANIIAVNFVTDTDESVWLQRLKDIEVVINCVGILYHPNKKVTWAIHSDAPCALFKASVTAGVKKIIQISALGVDKATVEYGKSKKSADDCLQSLPIISIILRPSMVYGAGSYGGGSLFRGLAGLPYVIPVPGGGKQQMQPIHVQDLSKAVTQLIASQQQSILLTAVGPKPISLRDMLITLRDWLTFATAFVISIPLFLFRIGSWFGNFIPFSVMNNESYAMLQQQNVASNADAQTFFTTVGFTPRDFTHGVYSEPSRVQDRWHARLYFLRPALRVIIALVWIFTGICSIWLYPRTASYELLTTIGVQSAWQPAVLFGGAILDMILGFAMLINVQIRKVAVLQIALMIIYMIIITFKFPQLWLDPFGPITKNIPLIASILVVLALESDR